MKYAININQAGVVNAGLHTRTDCTDWALLDYIFGWQQNPKAKTLSGKVWLNYVHIVGEMPLLGLRTKSSISNRIKKLRELDLIETTQSPVDQRLYVKTSSSYFDISQFSAARTVHEKEHPVHIEERGVPEKVHSLVNQDTKSNTKRTITTDSEKSFENRVLTAEEQECWDWAVMSAYWVTACVSIESFLKVYANKKGGLVSQFNAHKKARETWTANGLNSENKTFNKSGEHYETSTRNNQSSKLSAVDRSKQACQRIRDEWNARNNIIDI